MKILVAGQGSIELEEKNDGIVVRLEAGGGREGTKPISDEVFIPPRKIGDIVKVIAGVEGIASGMHKGVRWAFVTTEGGYRFKMRKEENGEVYEGSIRFRGRNLLKLLNAIKQLINRVPLVVVVLDGLQIIKSGNALTLSAAEGTQVLYGRAIEELKEFLHNEELIIPGYKGGVMEKTEEGIIKVGTIPLGETEKKVLKALL